MFSNNGVQFRVGQTVDHIHRYRTSGVVTAVHEDGRVMPIEADWPNVGIVADAAIMLNVRVDAPASPPVETSDTTVRKQLIEAGAVSAALGISAREIVETGSRLGLPRSGVLAALAALPMTVGEFVEGDKYRPGLLDELTQMSIEGLLTQDEVATILGGLDSVHEADANPTQHFPTEHSHTHSATGEARIGQVDEDHDPEAWPQITSRHDMMTIQLAFPAPRGTNLQMLGKIIKGIGNSMSVAPIAPITVGEESFIASAAVPRGSSSGEDAMIMPVAFYTTETSAEQEIDFAKVVGRAKEMLKDQKLGGEDGLPLFDPSL